MAFVLRVLFAFSTSAGSGFALSGGSDAAYHLHVIERILTTGGHVITDPALNYPFGGLNYNPPLFDWSVAIAAYPLTLFGYSTSEAASIALVFSTAVVGALTCIPVYLLAKEMFSRRIAIIASAFFAISAVAIVQTVFSNGTESAYFVFFFVLMTLFLLRALKAFKAVETASLKASLFAPFGDKKVFRNMLFASLSLIALMLSWIGFLSVIMILSFIMVVQAVLDRLRGKSAMSYVSIYGSIMLFALLICSLYYALIMGMYMVIGGPLCLALLMIAISFIISFHRVWVITIPLSIVIAIVVLAAIWFTMPSLYTAMTAGFYPYADGKFSQLINAYSSVTLSTQAIYAGVVTMWFSFIVAAIRIFGIPKNADSKPYMFITMWFVALIYMSWSNIDLAYLAAPMYAIGAGVVILWILRRIHIKDYIASFKGSTVKSVWRKIIKPVPLITVLATVFVLLMPNVLYAVDASIPSNEKANYNADMHLGSPDTGSMNYLGATNYFIKDNNWSLSTAWDAYADEEKSGALVTWLDYGAEAAAKGNFQVIADHFGNGVSAASNILLGTSQEAVASMAVRLMLTENEAFWAAKGIDGDLLKIIYDGEVPSLFVPVKTDNNVFVRENPDIFGAVDYNITAENAMYMVAAYYLTQTLTDGEISELYNDVIDKTKHEIGYIGVTGSMLPIYYGDNSMFGTMAYLNDYYLDRYASPSKYFYAGIPYYGYYYYYNDIMYETMIWKALVGMSLEDYRAFHNDPSLSFNTLMRGLMLSDGTYKAYPGFGLSNFEVDKWWVMYNPEDDASGEWVLMDGWEAQDLQATERKGVINYLGGMSFLQYNKNASMFNGTVMTPGCDADCECAHCHAADVEKYLRNPSNFDTLSDELRAAILNTERSNVAKDPLVSGFHEIYGAITERLMKVAGVDAIVRNISGLSRIYDDHPGVSYTIIFDHGSRMTMTTTGMGSPPVVVFDGYAEMTILGKIFLFGTLKEGSSLIINGVLFEATDGDVEFTYDHYLMSPNMSVTVTDGTGLKIDGATVTTSWNSGSTDEYINITCGCFCLECIADGACDGSLCDDTCYCSCHTDLPLPCGCYCDDCMAAGKCLTASVPVKGLTVALYDLEDLDDNGSPKLIGITKTDENGNYSMLVPRNGNVPRDPAMIETIFTSGSAYSMEVHAGTPDVNGVIKIEMADVIGTITNLTTKDVAEDILITMTGKYSGMVYTFNPSALAEFTVMAVPDTYAVTMNLNGNDIYTGTFTLYSGEMNVGEINVRSVTARITIEDRYGQKMENAVLEIFLEDEFNIPFDTLTTDENGVLEMFIAPGNYWVQLKDNTYDGEKRWILVPNTSNSLSVSSTTRNVTSSTMYTNGFTARLGSTATLTLVLMEAAEVKVSGIADGDVITLSNGAYAPRGTYTTTVIANVGAAPIQSIWVPTGDYGDASSYTATVTKASDGKTSYYKVDADNEVDTTVPPYDTVTIKLNLKYKDGNENKPTNGVVSFISPDNMVISVPVNDDGKCEAELPELAPGQKYTVYAYVPPVVGKGLLAYVGSIAGNADMTTANEIILLEASHLYGTVSYSSVNVLYVPIMINHTVGNETFTIFVSTDSRGSYSALVPKSTTGSTKTYNVTTEQFFGWFMRNPSYSNGYSVTPTADATSRSVNPTPTNFFGEPPLSMKAGPGEFAFNTTQSVRVPFSYGDLKVELEVITTSGDGTKAIRIHNMNSSIPVFVMLRCNGMLFGAANNAPMDQWISTSFTTSTTLTGVKAANPDTDKIEVFILTSAVAGVTITGVDPCSILSLDGKYGWTEHSLIPGSTYTLKITPGCSADCLCSCCDPLGCGCNCEACLEEGECDGLLCETGCKCMHCVSYSTAVADYITNPKSYVDTNGLSAALRAALLEKSQPIAAIPGALHELYGAITETYVDDGDTKKITRTIKGVAMIEDPVQGYTIIFEHGTDMVIVTDITDGYLQPETTFTGDAFATMMIKPTGQNPIGTSTLIGTMMINGITLTSVSGSVTGASDFTMDADHTGIKSVSVVTGGSPLTVKVRDGTKDGATLQVIDSGQKWTNVGNIGYTCGCTCTGVIGAGGHGDYYTGSVRIYAGQTVLDVSKLVKQVIVVEFKGLDSKDVVTIPNDAIDATPEDPLAMYDKLYYIPIDSLLDTYTVRIGSEDNIAFIDINKLDLTKPIKLSEYSGPKMDVTGYVGRIADGEMIITLALTSHPDDIIGTVIVPIKRGEFEAVLPKTIGGEDVIYEFFATVNDSAKGRFTATKTFVKSDGIKDQKNVVNMEVTLSPTSFAAIKVKGTVTSYGEPLIGAVVEYEVNGKPGTVTTNFDGYYMISAPAGSVVEITGVTRGGHTLKTALPPAPFVVSGTYNFVMEASVIIEQTNFTMVRNATSGMVEVTIEMIVTNNSGATVVLIPNKAWSRPAFEVDSSGSTSSYAVIPDGATSLPVELKASYDPKREGAGSANLSISVRDLLGNTLQTKMFDTEEYDGGKLETLIAADDIKLWEAFVDEEEPTDWNFKVSQEGNRISKNEYGFAVTFTNNTDLWVEVSLKITGASPAGVWFASLVDADNVLLAKDTDGPFDVIIPGNSTVTYYLRLMGVGDVTEEDLPSGFTLRYSPTPTTTETLEWDDMELTGLTVGKQTVTGNNIYTSMNSMPNIVWILIAVIALTALLIFWLGMRRGVFSRKR